MSELSAKIVAHSKSAVTGKTIVTYELEYPRFIHAEFNTHRMISKNAASSRAIPVKAMLENLRLNPAMPSHWGKNQPGMQAKEEHNSRVVFGHVEVEHHGNFGSPAYSREQAWTEAMNEASLIAEAFADAGYHKQIVNRLTEPFQMIKVVATGTEWDNFFWLRKHEDAQPEIRILAEKMWEALRASEPEVLQPGEWHTPYVKHRRVDGTLVYEIDTDDDEYPVEWLSVENALKVSSSMCAQVSYRKSDDTLEKALMVYERLVESKPVHASPFEHQATPMSTGNDITVWADLWENGVTSVHHRLGPMSGNLAGWIQHRQLIDGNTCWSYISN